MQRGGGEDEEVIVAISPPPQFQDTPAHPPPVFADCLTDFASRISFDILNEAMVIATGELVLLHGPHDVQGGGGPSSSHISPGSSEEDLSSSSSSNDSNPLSTTTSWEFISKASSWSDLRCLHFQPQSIERTHTSPRHQSVLNGESKSFKKNGLFCANSPLSFRRSPIVLDNQCCFKVEPSSSSKMSEATNILGRRSFVSVSQRISPMTSSSISPAIHRFTSEGPIKTNHQNSAQAIASSSRTSISGEVSSCYKNVPFQCDIYSMPVDSIASSNDESSDRPIPTPRRSRIRDSRGILLHTHQNNRKSSYDLQSNGANGSSHLSTSTQPFVRIEVSNLKTPSQHLYDKQSSYSESSCVREDAKPFTNDCSSTKEQIDFERNNNEASSSGINNSDAVCNNSSMTKAARRSRSVEINSTTQASKEPATTSQSTRNESCAEFSQEGHDKPEKKWLGHSILNLFKRHKPRLRSDNIMTSCISISSESERYTNEVQDHVLANATRALPPTPSEVRVQSISTSTMNGAGRNEILDDNLHSPPPSLNSHETSLGCIDFAASIEKVKDCGWYWGPLSSESAEDLLRGEPDGSFIVRDSSDAHYIFSLTFKLNGLVRHVRIEHDQGNFSFGPLTRFKAATIVDFVEKAVAHSRSGRYLFFLHRRPVLGPMRVQLLHPYSRFRHPRSLQHMCRFVILKSVRRDLIHTLPLPKPLQDYLNTPHYYFEQPEEKR